MAKGGEGFEAYDILFDTFWETLKLLQLTGDPSHVAEWEIFLNTGVCSDTCYSCYANERV